MNLSPSPIDIPSDAVSDPLPGWIEAAVRALDERKGLDILLIDIRDVSDLADYFLIATGHTDRHVKALANAVQEALDPLRRYPSHVSGYERGQWIVLDYMDAVVHVFDPASRDHYRLERLWSRGRRIEGLLEAPLGSARESGERRL